MTIRLYTDEELQDLQDVPKQVSNPKARWKEKPKGRAGHRQRTYNAAGGANGEQKFLIYQRENLVDPADFSCGIALLPLSGLPLTLARYNGPSHVHAEIDYRPHIHRASEQAIAAGRKPEAEARETDRYRTLGGALACLIEDYNVAGIISKHDQPELL